MVFTNYGFLQLSSFVVGSSITFPGSAAFGAGSATFVGSQTHLNAEFNRRPISWTWNGTDPQGTVTFSTTEFNGSVFNELGITNASGANGSNIWSRDVGAVGSKASNFALEFVFDVRFRRF